MSKYTVSVKALRDMADIIGYLHTQARPSAANTAESRLFTAFSDLAELQAVGHRRPDLTDRKILFYAVSSYVILFRPRKQDILIVRVVHSARDITKFL